MKTAWTGQIITPCGSRQLAVQTSGQDERTVHIPELAVIEVTGERIAGGICPQCDAVPNLNRRVSFHPWGIPQSVLPESVHAYCLDPDGKRRELVEGSDYRLSWPDLGHISFLNRTIFEERECYLDYMLKYQRVDVIAVNSDKEVKLFCGRESLSTPRWPMLPEGWEGIARVYSRFHDALDDDSVYEITDRRHARLINFEPRTDMADRMPFDCILDLSMKHPAADQIFTRHLNYDRYFDFTGAGAEALRERIARQKTFRIVFFGDSITQGGDVDPECRFTMRIADDIQRCYPNTRFEFVNAAIGGTGSYFGRERFDRDVLKHQPDAVTILFVLNDCGLPDEEVIANHLHFTKELRMINAIPIFLTPNMATSTWMGHLDNAVERIRQLCAREDELCVDVYSIWKDLRNHGIPYETLLANGINHPDNVAARIFFEGLKRLFALQGR